ncbi:MAG: MMPL family transporter [Verrucomicrobia bacterium]|nr:MMPL family transporter [Verrucomicrobiota bacterium]
MRSLFDSLPARALHRLAGWVYQYPRCFFYPQVVLFVASIFYTVQNLEFSTSRNDLVGSDKKYHTNFLRFKKEFSIQDDLVAVVESEDFEKNRQFVERLGARLEKETNVFSSVFYKGDLKMMGHKALLFLPESTLAELYQTLAKYRPFLEHFGQATNLNSLFRQVNLQFRTARREQNDDNKSLIGALPALRRIVEQAADSLNRPGTPPSPGITAFFNAGEEAEQGEYITFAHGKIYLVTARAQRPELDNLAVERLRELVFQTQSEVPGVNVGITGESVLEFDEMRQSQRDSVVASVFSLVMVALIFGCAYRETGRPVKATVCLVVGLVYTMGYTTLAVGHLNILTVTFLPMLIGLAIDFGIHLITRYEEELRRGQSVREALEKAMVNTGLGIFTGCFTTAGAFMAMGFTDFKGIQEMGIITGGGLLVCLAPMLTLLPVLLLRGHQNVMDQQAPRIDRRARIERLWLERPLAVTVAALVLCGLSYTQFRKVFFDYNLLNMQARGLPAVDFEKKLIDGASKSVLYGAVIADSASEAVRLETQITNLTSVASVDSLSRFLVEDPARKLPLVRQIKESLATVHFAQLDLRPLKPSEVSETFYITGGYLGQAAQVVEKEGDEKLLQELNALRNAINELLRRIGSGDPERIAAQLTAFQKALFADLQETFAALRSQDDREALRIEDLPQTLRKRFIGSTGKHLLQVYPKENVWQRDKQEAFVKELRQIDPNVTGTPVQLYEYTTLLKESYEEAAWYALGAVAVLVFIHFRRVSSVILALLPVGVGSVWMVGLMGVLEVPFNPANIMTLPLVVGIGVTNGVHILNRYAEELNPGILAKSTGKAVLISGLTTIAGFGSLIPSKHQGIASLGVVMTVGVATCMVAALTFLPCLLNLRTRVTGSKQ